MVEPHLLQGKVAIARPKETLEMAMVQAAMDLQQIPLRLKQGQQIPLGHSGKLDPSCLAQNVRLRTFDSER